MAYPPHYLLSYGGDFASDPSEIWANNIRFAVDDNVDGAEHQSYSDADMTGHLATAVASVTAMVASGDGGYSSNVRLKWVKFNEIGPDGRYVSEGNSYTHFLSGAGTTGYGNAVGPITNSMVITFLTDKDRGPASRGRVFVPHPSKPLDTSTFRWSLTNRGLVVEQWRGWMASTSFGTGPNALQPAVVSNVPVDGLARTVTRVQVGDFPDYMGSRRNRLTENRTTSAAIN